MHYNLLPGMHAEACMLKQQENGNVKHEKNLQRSQQNKLHFKTHAYSIQNGTNRKFSSAFMALTKMIIAAKTFVSMQEVPLASS